MLYIVKVISSVIESGFRKIKIRRLGNDDIRTSTQTAPFGIDSVPSDGMVAIFSDTNKKGKQVIIGYVNRNLLAAAGETRLYSLDSNGELISFIWLKSSGQIQIGGSDYSAVRFAPLKSGLDNSISLLNAELEKIRIAISGLGGTYTKSDVTLNISNAENTQIKMS